MPAAFQVSLLIDPRFPGGTSTAVAAELRALERAGIVPAICPVLSRLLRRSSRFHPAIADALAAGRAVLADAGREAETGVAIVHHPMLFETLPADPVRLRPRRLVLVLHHPPFDGLGRPEYDLAAILANVEESFGVPALVAPVGPAVRRQIAHLPAAEGRVLDSDWHNLADFDAPVPRDEARRGPVPILGRHSRPQLSKYPDTLEEALQCYPEHPDFQVRMMGVPDGLAEHYGRLPWNWDLLPFGAMPARDFLASLDFYVYFHGRSWVEAFGIGILEAIAGRVPVILPPAFRDLFGPSALYSAPAGVLPLLQDLAAAPETCRAHAVAAREAAAKRFGLDRFTHRLDGLLPDWRDPPATGPAAPPRGKAPAADAIPVADPRRVVMMTSNGIGLGHLTRCLAVASRFAPGTETAFFTLSQGFQLAVEAGYPTQFVPFHTVTGADPPRWNRALAEELGDFLDFFRPDILVFDGNVPYEGLIAALQQRPAIKRVWLRRALWTPPDDAIPGRGAHFDLVIQPGELCGRFDATASDGPVPTMVRVDPIVGLRPADRADRCDARRELGLSDDAMAIGVMLGAGNNFDLGAIRNALLARLAALPAADVIEIVSPIRRDDGGQDAGGHRRIPLYPASRHANAFDFMVTGAGYNSFHEAMLGGVPAIYVPNEAPEMDLQILRARYAARIGCGEVLRASERLRIPEVVDRIADPDARAEMRRRMARLVPGDGGQDAADLILRFAHALRTVDAL